MTASRSRACACRVLEHDELGLTNTRADGKFDLAVNGGGVTLQFERAGYLTVQRTLSPELAGLRVRSTTS